jgi:hypothetical protein
LTVEQNGSDAFNVESASANTNAVGEHGMLGSLEAGSVSANPARDAALALLLTHVMAQYTLRQRTQADQGGEYLQSAQPQRFATAAAVASAEHVPQESASGSSIGPLANLVDLLQFVPHPPLVQSPYHHGVAVPQTEAQLNQRAILAWATARASSAPPLSHATPMSQYPSSSGQATSMSSHALCSDYFS